MRNTGLKIEKLTPNIGAEILNIDLSQPTEQMAQDIRAALLEHKVVFFRDQPLTKILVIKVVMLEYPQTKLS